MGNAVAVLAPIRSARQIRTASIANGADVAWEFSGRPIEIRYAAALRDPAGNEALASTYVPERIIVLHRELRANPPEHARVLAHELFHFAWVRLGNTLRWEWESLLEDEWRNGVPGEAGWSAEWRKELLKPGDLRRRTRRWREYCCEAFCDTGAALATAVFSESTLRQRPLRRRRVWFERLTRLRL